MTELNEIPKLDSKLTRAALLKVAARLERDPPVGLKPVTLSVLATFATDMLKPFLLVEFARRGMLLSIRPTPFGQVEQQIVDSSSNIYNNDIDGVLLLMRLSDVVRGAEVEFLGRDAERLETERQHFKEWITRILGMFRERSAAALVVGNFTPAEYLAAGLADCCIEGSQTDWIQSLNRIITEVCADISRCFVLDVARSAVETGLSRWLDQRLDFLASAPLSGEAMVSLSRRIARTVRALDCCPRKCLVLDMDNTLWGGIIGEDGFEGIGLGSGYPGNVFVDFQRKILSLSHRGILLAAASKNNSADVEAVLADHPCSVLKRCHFSAWEVHWADKVTSIKRIAVNLNIGLDSIVFVDDNPAEREWVRDQLREVEVVELPADPALYWKTIEDSGVFDSLTLTEEDRSRSSIYSMETARKRLKSSSANLSEFLNSLDMVFTVGFIDDSVLPRVAQLLGKTNQFNLTTRRHDEAQIRELCNKGVGIWVRIRDKFGDSGLVGVLLAVEDGRDGFSIDTLLMSCRVIGRRVETAMLSVLEHFAVRKGGRHITGQFFPTKKNALAASFFADHGFENDGDVWKLELESPRAVPSVFTIENFVDFQLEGDDVID